MNEKLDPFNVIDVGCGPGVYLAPFYMMDCGVFGIDACSVGGECLQPHQFERVDLRFPYTPKERYDLAICLEVAEHLHAKWAERLVDTLSLCSDTILLTAATPGQGGTNHYNERPHSYWLAMFWDRHQYTLHPLQTELREFVATLPAECSPWIKKNIFLLQRSK